MITGRLEDLVHVRHRANALSHSVSTTASEGRGFYSVHSISEKTEALRWVFPEPTAGMSQTPDSNPGSCLQSPTRDYPASQSP